MTTPLISLDALMARTRAVVAEKAKAKTDEAESRRLSDVARKRPLTSEETELKARADWEPVALVLIFDEWECACGAAGTAPAGLMIHSKHRRMAAERLLAPRFESQVDENLPRRYHPERRIVAMCHNCCETHGFLEQHKPSGPRPGPLVGQFAGEGAGFVKEWRTLTERIDDEDDNTPE